MLMMVCLIISCGKKDTRTSPPLTQHSQTGMKSAEKPPSPMTPVPTPWPEPGGTEDFEEGSAKPIRFNRTSCFRRSQDASSSGVYSMALRAPVSKDPVRRFIGGPLVKVWLPEPGKMNTYTVSLRTWIRELPRGRLMLRAIFQDNKTGAKKTIALDDLEEVEEGWSNHTFERSLEMDARGANFMDLSVLIDSGENAVNAEGLVFIDDINVSFSGNLVEQDGLNEGFESQISRPMRFIRSSVFKRTRDDVVSGNYSLSLISTLDNGPDHQLVGGDVARVMVPNDAKSLSVSMKIRVEELNRGSLILRGNIHAPDGRKLSTMNLTDITSADNAWASIEYDTLLRGFEENSTFNVYAALFYRNSRPVGRVYIDDVEFKFD